MTRDADEREHARERAALVRIVGAEELTVGGGGAALDVARLVVVLADHAGRVEAGEVAGGERGEPEVARQIDLEAEDIGRYAWARFGFVPDRGSWKFQVALEARRRLLRARQQIDPGRFTFYSEVLDSDDPASIRAVASWRDIVDSMEYDANGNALKVELGKALLLETPARWFGSFNLDDPETMAIYREYVRSSENG